MSARRRSAGVIGVSIGVLVATSGASWWIGSQASSPLEASLASAPVAAVELSAPVESRIIEDLLELRGRTVVPDLVDIEAGTTPPPGAARVVVTEMPKAAGESVAEGELVAEVSGRPVFVLAGAIPSYRDIVPGAEGKDVAQLQQALSRLGYRIRDRPGAFGPSTSRAVARFYSARGYQPLTAPAMPAPAPAAPAVLDQAAGAAVIEQAAVTPAPAPSVPYVAVSELAFVNVLPAVVSKVLAPVGSQPEASLIQLASGLVHVDVPVTEADGLAPGMAAVLRTATGPEVAGQVVSIGPAAQSTPKAAPPAATDRPAGPESPLGPSGLTARIQPTEPFGLEILEQDVQVTIKRSGTPGPVMSLPVSAVWSAADGTRYVMARDAAAGPLRKLGIEVGLSGGGFVEVRSADGGLQAGDQVLVQNP